MTTLAPEALDDAPPPADGDRPERPATAAGRPGLARRLWRGRPEDPAWVRPSLLGLLGVTAFAYLFALGDSGWANAFYSAAVQAGTRSWKAFFFGSSDASNFITVDKPPASLWVMELSARLFGVNAWSILVPQALEGVATVALVFATVRRWFSPQAALLAAAVTASVPVAVLMFRYNNPDALLVLLLTGAAYATVRALERADGRWLALATALVGTGFITKMLQAFLVLPAIGLVYLLAAPTGLGRRLRQLAVSGVALVAAAGWWVVAVELTPAADRPYIGGSQDNNLLNLIFGYNGLGRLSGNETGSVTGGVAAGGGSPWGPTGFDRLFQSSMGGQVSWLLPAAGVLLAYGLWRTVRAPRTDRVRAAFVYWGLVLVVSGATISFAQGIIHPYYTVALAPAIGALVGMGAFMAWRDRAAPAARGALAAAVAATALWSSVVLDRTPDWLPWLRPLVLVAGLGAAVGFACAPWLRGALAGAVVALALVAALAGPVAYGIDTIRTPHDGALPTAGPTLAVGGTAPGRGGPGSFAGAGGLPGGAGGRVPGSTGAPPRAGAATGGFAPGGAAGRGGAGRLGAPAGGGPGTGGAAGRLGAGGGLLSASTPGKALVALLERDASRYKWAAATTNSNNAAGYQLATDDPVMAIGGFNGTDPAPTLAEFERDVRAGDVHYYLASTGGLGGGGSGTTASQIATWVADHYAARVVDGTTVYDLAR